jgi:hypothetical protein
MLGPAPVFNSVKAMSMSWYAANMSGISPLWLRGVDIGTLADQLLDLVVVFEADLAVIALVL